MREGNTTRGGSGRQKTCCIISKERAYGGRNGARRKIDGLNGGMAEEEDRNENKIGNVEWMRRKRKSVRLRGKAEVLT